eukprot:1234782-Amphidinium_carterae.1
MACHPRVWACSLLDQDVRHLLSTVKEATRKMANPIIGALCRLCNRSVCTPTSTVSTPWHCKQQCEVCRDKDHFQWPVHPFARTASPLVSFTTKDNS